MRVIEVEEEKIYEDEEENDDELKKLFILDYCRRYRCKQWKERKVTDVELMEDWVFIRWFRGCKCTVVVDISQTELLV